MRVLGFILSFLFLLSLPSLGIEIPRAGWGHQQVIILFDVSANALNCKLTLKREFKALDQLLSPSSLKNGGVNSISFIIFSKEVLGTSTVKTKERLFRDKDFQKLSDKAKRSFVSLFKKVKPKAGSELSDLYGAIIYSLNLTEGKDSTIIILSSGIQNLNRNDLTPISLPKNVKRVLFFSHPFECTKYSESYKYKAFRTYVENYWKRLLTPTNKVKLFYSF